MVTIALSAHDVERWVWFTEGEAGDYAQMWLTLENEQTDNSGTAPVDRKQRVASDALPARQSIRRVRDPPPGAARRAACRRYRASSSPSAPRRSSTASTATPRDRAARARCSNFEETRGLVDGAHRAASRHRAHRRARAALRPRGLGRRARACTPCSSPDATRRDHDSSCSTGSRTGSSRTVGPSAQDFDVAASALEVDDMPYRRLVDADRRADRPGSTATDRAAELDASRRSPTRRSGSSRRSSRASAARRSRSSRRRAARARRRSRSTWRPVSPRSRRTPSCSSTPTCSSATSPPRSALAPERTIVDAVADVAADEIVLKTALHPPRRRVLRHRERAVARARRHGRRRTLSARLIERLRAIVPLRRSSTRRPASVSTRSSRSSTSPTPCS